MASVVVTQSLMFAGNIKDREVVKVVRGPNIKFRLYLNAEWRPLVG